MALELDYTKLVEPLSSDAPCGEDLDEVGDLDFLNQTSHVESLLPASFFTRDDEGRQQPFDRASIDFNRENKALLALLDRTRDLRVLTLLARLAMLNRDLAGFAKALAAIVSLLDAHWDAVHPRGEGGDYELRGAVLQGLDDTATVILPLQHVVLAQSRRHGAISFRTMMVANGEIPPREGEPALDRSAIEHAIDEGEPESRQAQADALQRISDEVARLSAVTIARGGYESAVKLDRLGSLVGRIWSLVGKTGGPAPGEEAAPAGDGEVAAVADTKPSVPRASGKIATAADAAAALAAAAGYLRSREPSSPAEILVRQAQMLVGKSFIEVMRILMPNRADEAVFAIGSNRGLRLTFDQLASVPDDPGGSSADAWTETGQDEGEDATVAPAVSFSAGSRAEAVALLKEAGTYFRSNEPASPIPLLIDKAIGVADRDFLAILRDVLPEE
ncbi:ImpA family type VI secretion system protein [Methylobacterium brachythecii]|uniref:Type VI secretion system protein ImpA n=1 Tax=Methylobacterium brachythecii TaxID=1176177 RepID=A0A7W6F6T6_9HYPH|nr:type VI secretion system ImpA family N-terminal domain-containing protein [Methylobacterium brachythecii]MBB3902376.1 type VI secretion system protein ImpA [Methylobacterium brachythecii]GLS42224.1 hypothetical protein GCM10007884_02090 [Methylobacterium brachythecii]